MRLFSLKKKMRLFIKVKCLMIVLIVIWRVLCLPFSRFGRDMFVQDKKDEELVEDDCEVDEALSIPSSLPFTLTLMCLLNGQSF